MFTILVELFLILKEYFFFEKQAFVGLLKVIDKYTNILLLYLDGVEQATQLVALQAEDGSQQLAVPVIDPHTGQVN